MKILMGMIEDKAWEIDHRKHRSIIRKMKKAKNYFGAYEVARSELEKAKEKVKVE